MTYLVLITDDALEELEMAYAYIARQSPNAADQWYNGCLEAVNSLARFPRRCRRAPESDLFEEEIRHLLYASHRIIFKIDGRTVTVVHVRHAAQRQLDQEGGSRQID